MKNIIHNLFFAGCILYIPAVAAALAGWKMARNVFYLTAVTFVFLSAAARIYYNWPLMCLFQEPYLISLFIAVIAFCLCVRRNEKSAVAVGGIAVAVSIFTLLFPGDIYTSFVKTNSLFAYLFSLFSSFARAAYLASAVLAALFLAAGRFGVDRLNHENDDDLLIRNLIIAGFACQSAAMFCGGLWSYVGWGSPVPWESYLLPGMAGVWFYCSFYLHLHLAGGVSRRGILYAAALGGVLSFIFTFLPDTGTFNFRGIIR